MLTSTCLPGLHRDEPAVDGSQPVSGARKRTQGNEVSFVHIHTGLDCLPVCQYMDVYVNLKGAGGFFPTCKLCIGVL